MRPTRFPLLLAAVLASGCGGRQPVPVRGRATLDGQPLAGVAVLFTHEEKDGRDASGFTDAEGRFVLRTFQPGDGAFPGEYKVVIQAPDSWEVPADVKTPAEVQKAVGTRVQPKKAAVKLPAVYTDSDKTILRQKVPAEGEVKLELRSDRR